MNTPLPSAIGRPATAALAAQGIASLEDVAKLTEKELIELHGVGPKAVRILKSALDERGLCLVTPRMDEAAGEWATYDGQGNVHKVTTR